MALQKYFIVSLYFKYLTIYSPNWKLRKSKKRGEPKKKKPHAQWSICFTGLSRFCIMNKMRSIIFYPAFIFIYWSGMSGIYSTPFFCWNLSFSLFILESKHIIFHYIKLRSGKSKIKNSFYLTFFLSRMEKCLKNLDWIWVLKEKIGTRAKGLREDHT